MRTHLCQLSSLLITLLIIAPGCLDSVIEESDIFHGDDYDPLIKVKPFLLQSHDGTNISLDDIDSKVIIFAFLFTECPDVCPIVSANLKFVSEQLGGDFGTNVTILTITVDPWRDDSNTLGNYVAQKELTWPHLTGEVEVLEEVWGNFGVGLKIVDNSTNTSGRHHPFDYAVDHSTGTVIVDSDRMQRVWWGDNDWAPDLFLEDVNYLLNE